MALSRVRDRGLMRAFGCQLAERRARACLLTLTAPSHAQRSIVVPLPTTACDRLALVQPILGLYGQMYAAKLAGLLDDGGAGGEPSASMEDGESAVAEAAFSPKKLMAWLDNPANKARMCARHACARASARAGCSQVSFFLLPLPPALSRRFPRTFALTRENRSSRTTQLFGDLIAKLEERQQRAHNGLALKAGKVAGAASMHGAMPKALMAEPLLEDELAADKGAESEPVDEDQSTVGAIRGARPPELAC